MPNPTPATTQPLLSPFVSTDCGSVRGIATPSPGTSGLTLNYQMMINGNADLSGCIVGNSRAKVYTITLSLSELGTNYIIMVDGEGPSGGTGSLYLWFTDSSGKNAGIYKLKIYEHSRQTHEVLFTADPNTSIVQVQWSDQDHGGG